MRLYILKRQNVIDKSNILNSRYAARMFSYLFLPVCTKHIEQNVCSSIFASLATADIFSVAPQT